MIRARSATWALVGLLSILVIATIFSVFYIFDSPNRDSASTLIAALAGIAAVTGPGLLSLLVRIRKSAAGPALPVKRAADSLAEEIRHQWDLAARERGLTASTEIPVRWRWSSKVVAGKPDSATASTRALRRFQSLPGMSLLSSQRLTSGSLNELFEVYAGVASGRLLILGEQGAGKSAAAIKLVLETLAHRAAVGPIDKERVPVPVILTPLGWDPNNEQFEYWVQRRVLEEYPLLRAPRYGIRVVAQLVRRGMLSVILDGFDEMAEPLRPVALQALNEQAACRLVVVTRSQEMVDAAARGEHLRGAAALELTSLDADQEASYIERFSVDPPPRLWQELIDHLREHPLGPLAQALETPLMLSILRDAYQPEEETSEDTALATLPTREAIENYLLDRLVSAAYRPHPPRKPRFSSDQACRWLGYIAHCMNTDGTRDLAWWQIPRRTPPWLRATATVIACELLVIPVVGLTVLLINLLASANVGMALPLVSKFGLTLIIGLVIGVAGAYASSPVPRSLAWIKVSAIRSGVVYGLSFGTVGGLIDGLVTGFVKGLTYGMTVGLVAGYVIGLIGTYGERPPRHLRKPKLDRGYNVVYLLYGVIVGPAAGVMYGLVARNGIAAAFIMCLIVWLASAIAIGSSQSSTGDASPIDPAASIRRNRRLGLVIGLVVALSYDLVQAFVFSLSSWLLVVWLVSGAAMGAAAAITFPGTWQVLLAAAVLRFQGKVEIVRLLPFLEDARARHILRAVGQVYQFRHSRLQDRLAALYEQQ